MALDLGAVELSVRVRTDNIDRDMAAATAKVEAAADRAKAEINVAPKGTRELDSAASSADGLSRNLDKAAGSAGKIQPPTAATRGLGEAAAAAEQLGRGLDEAAGSSQKIKPNPSVPSSLGDAAAKARKLSEELDRAGQEAQELGSSTGGIGSMGGALSGVMSTVRGLVPALGAAAAASSALTKGWDRLTSIDNAQFKLQGLGHTAEGTADIMASAMDAVSGTAYGFGDAASLAAGAVAATGAEGARLTEILTTIADTSAISGRSLGDMGMIFNQVAASGTLMGDDLNQLMDSGIPVLTMLADELGVTAGEVKKLASEGEVSFETFEAAMRNNMGGAAQEMGASVTGSLANVGAALGRLGAAVLTPGFKSLPDALEGVKGGVDSLTEGVGAVTEVFSGLPGPVKAAVAALATAKAGSMLLGTELGGRVVGALGAVRDGLVNSASSVGDFGSSLRDAYRYAGEANPQLGALGRTMEVVGGQGGVASAAMGGMRSAAGGLLTALGGPWGLAIGGATAAVGLFMSQVQKTKQAQEETEAATQAWADVLTKADGQITESVQKHALLSVEQANLAEHLDKVGFSSADAAAAILDLDGSYDSMIASLDRIIEQGNNDPTALRGRWYTEEAQAAMELKSQIEELHGTRVNGVTAAEDAAEAESKLAAEIAESSREAGNAQGAHDVLNEVLAQMGIDAKSADDAISNLAGAMMGLSEDPAIRLQSYLGDSAAAIEKISKEVAEGGMGGFDIDTGVFDEWTEQGRKLTGTMGDVKESLFEVAAAQYQTSLQMGDSGVVASEKAAAAAREHSDALREQLAAAGVGKEAIDALFESYGLFPDDIMTHIHVAGSETATAVLDSLDERMARVDAETHTITVDADSLQMTAEEADELGFKLENMEKEGLIRLTAETELAQSAIEDIAAQTEELGTADNRVVFRADAIELTEQLNEIEGFTAELVTDPHELKILADTEESRAAIEELGVQTAELPTGEIYVLDNTPDVMANLEAAGAETVGLPEGNIVITDTSPQNIAALQQLGVETTRLPNGNVVIRDNSAETKRNIENNLASRVLNRTGKVTMNIIENISQVFSRSTGGTTPRRAQGGTIPALAAGGNTTHGGYRLPSTGPGTERTDGILGLDSLGIPTAWVDREEFVTNRARTSEYLNTLWAINSGSEDDVVRALLADLGGLNSGGVVESITGLVRRYWPMMTVTSTYRGTNDHHGSGLAVDFSNGTDSTPEMRSAAQWFYQYFGSSLLELIHSPFSNNVKNGKNVGDGFGFYGAGTMGQHRNHVHVASASPLRDPGSGEVTSTGATGEIAWDSPGAPTIAEIEGMQSAVQSISPVARNRAEFHSVETQEGKSGVGSTFGGTFNVPGLASNASNVSVGASVPAAHQAAALAREHGYGAEAEQLLGTRNPFVGVNTWRDTLGGDYSAQLLSIASQLEAELGHGGITAQVDAALNMNTPNWDVWLRVSPETIEAFNRLGEAEAARENASYDVADAERELAEARKALGEVTGEGVEMSTSAARRIEDAEESLRKAREPNSKGEVSADKIADAEKKLTRAREDAATELEKSGAKNAEEAVKASENVARASANLTQEREKEQRAISQLQKAQQDYQVATAMAPINALTELLDGVVAGVKALSDAFTRLDQVIQSTNEVLARHQDAQVNSAQATLSAVGAEQSLVRQERAARSQRHRDVLMVQQAEWDLAMARAEAAEVAGAAEVDLAGVRESGIYQVMQTSMQADQRAIMSAQHVAMMEAALAVAKAEQAYREQQAAYDSQIAMIELEFAQREAELQAGYLSIATMELATIQGEAAGIAGYGASALAKKTEGTATKQSGIFGLLGSVLKGAAGVLLAPATGGASLILTASAVAEGIGHIGNIASGSAQEKAYEEEAQREFDALPEDIQAMIVAQQAGIPLAAAAGALMGAAGGSRDDVALVQESVQGAFSVGLDIAISKAQAELQAAEAQRQREERELAIQERQNRLDELQARLEADTGAFDQENYLAEILETARMQYEELVQENKQLGEINGHLAPKNQSVLMQLGGSSWGDGAGGPSLADMSAGFGGLVAGMVDPWSSISVEERWGNVAKGRMITPWDDAEDSGWRSPIADLPDTVVDGYYSQTSADRDAYLVEQFGKAIASAMQELAGDPTAESNVEYQFTGDVTIDGRAAQDAIEALAEELARA